MKKRENELYIQGKSERHQHIHISVIYIAHEKKKLKTIAARRLSNY